MGNTTCMYNRGTDVIHQLFTEQGGAVVNGTKHFSDRQRCCGVLTDQPEALLQFCGHGVFQPKQAERLQILAQARRLDRCQSMVCVVQQMDIVTYGIAYPLEQLGRVTHVFLGRPYILFRKTAVCRLVIHLVARDPIGAGQSGYARLGTNGAISQILVARHFIDCFSNIGAVSVPIDHHTFAGAPPQQLIQWHIRQLRLDIPKRYVHCCDSGHGHRATSPLAAAVKILPDILDLLRVTSDQAGHHVISQIRNNRKLPPIERRVADAVYALIRQYFQGDKVSARTGDNHFCVNNFHRLFNSLFDSENAGPLLHSVPSLRVTGTVG